VVLPVQARRVTAQCCCEVREVDEVVCFGSAR